MVVCGPSEEETVNSTEQQHQHQHQQRRKSIKREIAFWSMRKGTLQCRT